MRARRPHGRAGRAGARRARARRGAAGAAAGGLPAERGGLPLRRRAARATRSCAALAPAAVVAAHVHPELPWGAVALDPGTVNASCDAVEITVEGEPSHGAYPHRGRDPILAIAQIVVALHAQVGRRIDPLARPSLTVGVIEGGERGERDPRARARARRAARPPAARIASRCGAMVEEVVARRRRGARLPRQRRADARRAGARERPGDRVRARASCSRARA